MKRLAAAVITVGLFAAVAFAQAPTRKPGEEEKRIGYFAGKWTHEGEVKASPMGPGGKTTGSETCEWFAGGFHLVCRSESKTPAGAVKAQSIMGYDPTEKNYTFYMNTDHGEGFFVRGNVSGPVWTWDTEFKVEGKPMKIRVTISLEPPSSYAFKMESSMDGGTWTLMETSKATKVR